MSSRISTRLNGWTSDEFEVGMDWLHSSFLSPAATSSLSSGDGREKQGEASLSFTCLATHSIHLAAH